MGSRKRIPGERASPAYPGGPLPGESGPEYEAFAIYRDLGKQRSYLKAYIAHRLAAGARGVPRRLPYSWKCWAVKNRWAERAKAWERHYRALRCARLNERMERIGL